MTKNKKTTKKTKALVVAKQPVPITPSILPAIPDKKWIKEYNEFLDNYDHFIDKQMISDTDFGIIPGTQKPTLYLAGAQKLEKLFFLTSRIKMIEKVIDDGYSFVKYTYKTFAYRGDVLVATCEGSCNSKEKKYRFETVFDNQANEEQRANGKLETRTSRAGKPYSVYVVEKKEFYDIENTIMKMAQKRSYVGAILTATASSGRFTQDIEDMDLGKNKFKPQQAEPLKVIDIGDDGFAKEPKEPFADRKGPRKTGMPKTTTQAGSLLCSDCGNEISQAEEKYSQDFFGKVLGRCCQSSHRKIK